jgi:hypothetical protein
MGQGAHAKTRRKTIRSGSGPPFHGSGLSHRWDAEPQGFALGSLGLPVGAHGRDLPGILHGNRFRGVPLRMHPFVPFVAWRLRGLSRPLVCWKDRWKEAAKPRSRKEDPEWKGSGDSAPRCSTRVNPAVGKSSGRSIKESGRSGFCRPAGAGSRGGREPTADAVGYRLSALRAWSRSTEVRRRLCTLTSRRWASPSRR